MSGHGLDNCMQWQVFLEAIKTQLAADLVYESIWIDIIAMWN